MDPSFSSGLDLSGMSSATAMVVALMIVFLIILILGIGLVFKRQLSERNASYINNPQKSKGFQKEP